MNQLDSNLIIDKYIPSKEERQLGDFGYADEDDDRRLDWCGEPIDDDDGLIDIEDIEECHDLKNSANLLPKNLKVTERDIDKYVDSTGHSYYEAYVHFGVKPSDIDYAATKEQLAPENAAYKPGIAVNLGKRAIHLLDAISYYSKSSGLAGFATVLQDRNDINRLEWTWKRQELHAQDGDAAFAKAFGSLALIEAGYDTKTVKAAEHEGSNSFYHQYTGVENAKKRNKFRKTLTKQTKNFNIN